MFRDTSKNHSKIISLDSWKLSLLGKYFDRLTIPGALEIC